MEEDRKLNKNHMEQNQALEDPLLRRPEVLALLTETYDKAEHCTATRYGKKISQMREGYIAGNISTAVITATTTFIFATILFKAIS